MSTDPADYYCQMDRIRELIAERDKYCGLYEAAERNWDSEVDELMEKLDAMQRRAEAAEGDWQHVERKLNQSHELLRALVLALQSGASTSEILETIQGGAGITFPPGKHAFNADVNELSECQHCGWPKEHENHVVLVPVRCSARLPDGGYQPCEKEAGPIKPPSE